MSWLSKRIGVEINVRKLIPAAFLTALEAKAYGKAVRQLDDESLRALSVALDYEWLERKRKAEHE